MKNGYTFVLNGFCFELQSIIQKYVIFSACLGVKQLNFSEGRDFMPCSRLGLIRIDVEKVKFKINDLRI